MSTAKAPALRCAATPRRSELFVLSALIGEKDTSVAAATAAAAAGSDFEPRHHPDLAQHFATAGEGSYLLAECQIWEAVREEGLG